MGETQQPDGGSITVDVSQKKVSMTGRDSLIAFMLVLLIASWAYIAHFRLDTVDKTHANFADSLSKSTADILKMELERAKQMEELLRINQRSLAALEVIAARIGQTLAPYNEHRILPREGP